MSLDSSVTAVVRRIGAELKAVRSAMTQQLSISSGARPPLLSLSNGGNSVRLPSGIQETKVMSRAPGVTDRSYEVGDVWRNYASTPETLYVFLGIFINPSTGGPEPVWRLLGNEPIATAVTAGNAQAVSSGAVSTAISAQVTAWKRLSLLNGWGDGQGVPATEYAGLRARRIPGAIQIQGIIYTGSAGSSTTTIAALPSDMQPITATRQAAFASGQLSWLFVDKATDAGNVYAVRYASGPTGATQVNINLTVPA